MTEISSVSDFPSPLESIASNTYFTPVCAKPRSKEIFTLDVVFLHIYKTIDDTLRKIPMLRLFGVYNPIQATVFRR